MCYGHPHHHPCGHQSVKWHYCPRAKVDASTGHATICTKTTYAVSQPAKTKCPLKNCGFKDVGGVWDCCECKQGPNTQGWCTFPNPSWKKNFQTDEFEWVETCDHGCCKNCTRSASAGPMPEDDSHSSKKKKRSRKSDAVGGSSSSAGAASSSRHAYGSSSHGGGYGEEYDEYTIDRHEQDGNSSSKHSKHHHKDHHKGKGKGKSRD